MEDTTQLLIARYFAGSLTPPEEQELKNHLASNPADRKTFDDYCLLWEESDPKFAVKLIDVEEALAKTKRRLHFRKTSLFRFVQQAAAVFILAGLFSTTYIYYYNSSKSPVHSELPAVMQEISTIFGTRSKFQLSDGTLVCLNSGSKLLVPVKFKGNTRNVELIGEAYFEVSTNPEKPFIVKTSDMNVKVLGTAFNLQAFPNSGVITTTLVHGKVILEKETNGLSQQIAELNPSHQAIYKTETRNVSVSKEEDLDKFIAWKDGKLVFYNDPIEDVAGKLGKWYNVNVKIVNNHLKSYRFTATFSDEPIEQVLNLLSKSSPMKYKITKAIRLSDNSYSMREIIIN